MFKRILIANRGEIAVRVIRACRDLGVETVAVYSEADRTALHVREADYAVAVARRRLQKATSRPKGFSRLPKKPAPKRSIPGMASSPKTPGSRAPWPQAGLVFIGPSPEAIKAMGDKVEARKAMAAAGVPVVPGSPGTLAGEAEVRAAAAKIGYPIMLKAAAGGGGKGLRFVEKESELTSAIRAVGGEAKSSFGDARIYVEKYLSRPRHIEFQVFADRAGKTVHVFERECSIQRRHQKVVEESPSPFITPAMRRAMGEVAVKAAQAVGYVGAGTIEFLADADRNFYFLEMNTRIQVEHAITEMVTGVDLVKAQIEVAAGAPLPFSQEDLSQHGWALECRIYAEDPAAGFVPAPGRIDTLRWPSGPGVRNDAGVYAGAEVPVFYDPMISKLVVWGRDRTEAIARMRRALGEFVIAGELTTNLDFHRWLMNHPVFLSGDYDTNFIEQEYHPRALAADGKSGGRDDAEFTAAMLAVAAAAQNMGNGRASETAGAGRQAARGESAWKTLGRLDVLRR